MRWAPPVARAAAGARRIGRPLRARAVTCTAARWR